MLIDLHPNLLVFTDPPIISRGHILGIHVMSRGRRHVSRGVENVCNIISLYIYIYNFILKRMSLDCLEISLIYELPNYRCIAGRMTFLSV
jgi:hypothetical protein